MNRALQALPKGERVAHPGGLGVGAMTPLVMRGKAPVLGWAPQSAAQGRRRHSPRACWISISHRDPALAQRADARPRHRPHGHPARDWRATAKPRGGADSVEGMRAAADGAARLLAQDDGPRLAALAFDGWDTHANEGGATGRLAQLLGGLDGALAALEETLGQRWKDTAILVVTEFGRTAQINGTVGTDHGTATVAFLAGGGVKGGAHASRTGRA